MIKQKNQIYTEHLELIQLDLIAEIDQLEYTVDVSDDFDRAMIVAAAEKGVFSISIDGIDGSEISEYSQVRAFIGKIGKGIKTLVVKISAKGAKNLQLSIAMIKKSFKNAIDQLPCKAFKTFAKIAVSAILAHLGIPFFEATKTIDMPGIELPPPAPGGAGIPAEKHIAVSVGERIELPEHAKQWFEEAVEKSKGQLATFFNAIDPRVLSTIHVVLESLNWFFDGVDKIYTRVCEILRCCRPLEA